MKHFPQDNTCWLRHLQKQNIHRFSLLEHKKFHCKILHSISKFIQYMFFYSSTHEKYPRGLAKKNAIERNLNVHKNMRRGWFFTTIKSEKVPSNKKKITVLALVHGVYRSGTFCRGIDTKAVSHFVFVASHKMSDRFISLIIIHRFRARFIVRFANDHCTSYPSITTNRKHYT